MHIPLAIYFYKVVLFIADVSSFLLLIDGIVDLVPSFVELVILLVVVIAGLCAGMLIMGVVVVVELEGIGT